MDCRRKKVLLVARAVEAQFNHLSASSHCPVKMLAFARLTYMEAESVELCPPPELELLLSDVEMAVVTIIVKLQWKGMLC